MHEFDSSNNDRVDAALTSPNKDGNRWHVVDGSPVENPHGVKKGDWLKALEKGLSLKTLGDISVGDFFILHTTSARQPDEIDCLCIRTKQGYYRVNLSKLISGGVGFVPLSETSPQLHVYTLNTKDLAESVKSYLEKVFTLVRDRSAKKMN